MIELKKIKSLSDNKKKLHNNQSQRKENSDLN